MEKDILELYPYPGRLHELEGLYLKEIAALQPPADRAFIYSNYITSLDGRIALPADDRDSHQVPPAIANPRDWRLFQELAAQADLLITSGRYFRQTAQNEQQAELPVGDGAAFEDLRTWRTRNGLKAQPDLAVMSASLDIPLDALSGYADREVFVITGGQADTEKLDRIKSESHAEVIVCGDQYHVDASSLPQQFLRLGYAKVYAIAGPAVLHTLVRGRALDRLYLTTAHCLVGGVRFDTISIGAILDPAYPLPLLAMYYDRAAPLGSGQTMAVYGR